MRVIYRADTTPRTEGDGPFSHLDIRWMIGEHTGAKLLAFGQTTYVHGATHEMHYHPNAEELVFVTSGRGEQIVGDDTLVIRPGDACFIPRGVPHQITGVSEDDLVIYWMLAGASSMESAGYEAVS